LVAAIASVAGVAAAALPGDSAEGKRLHDVNCIGCHDSGVYTRQTRSVRSLDALKQQLDTCGHATNKNLSAADKQSIVKYLNERFYKLQ
jgi:hypothetical protein